MAAVDMKSLARAGAAARLAELASEAAAIRKAFPGIQASGGENRFPWRKRKSAAASDSWVSSGRTRKRKPMSAAMKREVSKRMKKYWASRRAAKAKSA